MEGSTSGVVDRVMHPVAMLPRWGSVKRDAKAISLVDLPCKSLEAALRSFGLYQCRCDGSYIWPAVSRFIIPPYIPPCFDSGLDLTPVQCSSPAPPLLVFDAIVNGLNREAASARLRRNVSGDVSVIVVSLFPGYLSLDAVLAAVIYVHLDRRHCLSRSISTHQNR